MAKIDWRNYYFGDNPIELKYLQRKFEKQGWAYQEENFVNQKCVRDSSKKSWTSKTLREVLEDRKLVFGDNTQLQALKVLDFWKITDAFRN